MRLLHRVIHRQLRSCITKSIAADKTSFPFLSGFFVCPLQFALSFDVPPSLHYVSDLLYRGIAVSPRPFTARRKFMYVSSENDLFRNANILTFCTSLMGDSPCTSQEYIFFYEIACDCRHLLNQLLDYIFMYKMKYLHLFISLNFF